MSPIRPLSTSRSKSVKKAGLILCGDSRLRLSAKRSLASKTGALERVVEVRQPQSLKGRHEPDPVPRQLSRHSSSVELRRRTAEGGRPHIKQNPNPLQGAGSARFSQRPLNVRLPPSRREHISKSAKPRDPRGFRKIRFGALHQIRSSACERRALD